MASYSSLAQSKGTSSLGITVGASDISFTALNDKQSSDGLQYGIDYTWLNYFYKNFSVGINVSGSKFEGVLYSNKNIKYSSVIISPIISYRFLTLSPEFLGVKSLRYHDGLSVYVKAGLGYALSSINYNSGSSSMDEDGAVSSFAIGMKWQTTGPWAFGIQYESVDNTLMGVSKRDYGIENKSVLASLTYRFN